MTDSENGGDLGNSSKLTLAQVIDAYAGYVGDDPVRSRAVERLRHLDAHKTTHKRQLQAWLMVAAGAGWDPFEALDHLGNGEPYHHTIDPITNQRSKETCRLCGQGHHYGNRLTVTPNPGPTDFFTVGLTCTDTLGELLNAGVVIARIREAYEDRVGRMKAERAAGIEQAQVEMYEVEITGEPLPDVSDEMIEAAVKSVTPGVDYDKIRGEEGYREKLREIFEQTEARLLRIERFAPDTVNAFLKEAQARDGRHSIATDIDMSRAPEYIKNIVNHLSDSLDPANAYMHRLLRFWAWHDHRHSPAVIRMLREDYEELRHLFNPRNTLEADRIFAQSAVTVAEIQRIMDLTTVATDGNNHEDLSQLRYGRNTAASAALAQHRLPTLLQMPRRLGEHATFLDLVRDLLLPALQNDKLKYSERGRKEGSGAESTSRRLLIGRVGFTLDHEQQTYYGLLTEIDRTAGMMQADPGESWHRYRDNILKPFGIKALRERFNILMHAAEQLAIDHLVVYGVQAIGAGSEHASYFLSESRPFNRREATPIDEAVEINGGDFQRLTGVFSNASYLSDILAEDADFAGKLERAMDSKYNILVQAMKAAGMDVDELRGDESKLRTLAQNRENPFLVLITNDLKTRVNKINEIISQSEDPSLDEVVAADSRVTLDQARLQKKYVSVAAIGGSHRDRNFERDVLGLRAFDGARRASHYWAFTPDSDVRRLEMQVAYYNQTNSRNIRLRISEDEQSADKYQSPEDVVVDRSPVKYDHVQRDDKVNVQVQNARWGTVKRQKAEVGKFLSSIGSAFGFRKSRYEDGGHFATIEQGATARESTPARLHNLLSTIQQYNLENNAQIEVYITRPKR